MARALGKVRRGLGTKGGIVRAGSGIYQILFLTSGLYAFFVTQTLKRCTHLPRSYAEGGMRERNYLFVPASFPGSSGFSKYWAFWDTPDI